MKDDAAGNRGRPWIVKLCCGTERSPLAPVIEPTTGTMRLSDWSCDGGWTTTEATFEKPLDVVHPPPALRAVTR